VIYDTTQVESFKNVTKWLSFVKKLIQTKTDIVLVGSKIDLTEERAVDKEIAQEFALCNNLSFEEISITDRIQTNKLLQRLSFNLLINKREV